MNSGDDVNGLAGSRQAGLNGTLEISGPTGGLLSTGPEDLAMGVLPG